MTTATALRHTAAPASRGRKPLRLPARWRKLLLTVHVLFAVAWVGMSAGMVALGLLGVATADAAVATGVYEAMKVFDLTIITIASIVATLSGIMLALLTPWGLFRHWWIVAKLTLTLAVFVSAFTLTHPWVLASIEHTRQRLESGGGPGGDEQALSIYSPVMCLFLTTAAVLSIYKPWGRTRGRSGKRGKQVSAERTLAVSDVRSEADGVVSIALTDPSGAPLPAWQPGAHIDLLLPSGKVRQYSLCGDPADTGTYRVGVLREPEGRGGSIELHRMRPGQRLGLRGPRNHFRLADAPEYLFIAGGIGVTPLIPMIRTAEAAGTPWRLIYAGRSRSTMAYTAELAAISASRVRIVARDVDARPDLAAAIRAAGGGVAVYCCGPERLIDAVEKLVPTVRPDASVHVERFAAPEIDDSDNVAFEVELTRGGQVLTVPADRGMLDTIRDAVPEADGSCEDGVCGSCELAVLRGLPLHRDGVLAAAERDRTDVIYPCVSRARSQRLVVDL